MFWHTRIVRGYNYWKCGNFCFWENVMFFWILYLQKFSLKIETFVTQSGNSPSKNNHIYYIYSTAICVSCDYHITVNRQHDFYTLKATRKKFWQTVRWSNITNPLQELFSKLNINSIPYLNATLQPVPYYRGKSVACTACRRPVGQAWRCRYFPTRTRLPYWRAWSPPTCPCLRTDTCRRWRPYRIESPHLCAPIQTTSLLEVEWDKTLKYKELLKGSMIGF